MADTKHGDSESQTASEGTADAAGPAQRFSQWRESFRDRKNVNRAYRIAVGVVGGAIVVGGLGLIPLPGPGWVIVFVGLAILATEFVWAKKTEEFAKRQVSAWTDWLRRQSIVVRSLVGLLTFAFVVAVIYVVMLLLGVPSWVPDSWVSIVPGWSKD